MTVPPEGAPLHPGFPSNDPLTDPPDVVPPHSRVPAHVAGALVGLAVAPLAVGALLVGSGGLVGSVEGVVHGEGLFLLGALLFALWAVLAGALSSLTMAIPAVTWFLAVPLIAGPASFHRISAPSGFEMEVLWALDILAVGNGWVIIAALLLGCAVAIHVARRAGRRTERAEAALATTPSAPPPSRLAAHLGATMAAAVLAVVAGLITTIPAPPAIAALSGAALGTAATLGGLSALAPLVAGATGVISQVAVQLELVVGGTTRLAEAVDPYFGAVAAGAGWTWWTMLLISSLAPWQARRVGRVLERAEIAINP